MSLWLAYRLLALVKLAVRHNPGFAYLNARGRHNNVIMLMHLRNSRNRLDPKDLEHARDHARSGHCIVHIETPVLKSSITIFIIDLQVAANLHYKITNEALSIILSPHLQER